MIPKISEVLKFLGIGNQLSIIQEPGFSEQPSENSEGLHQIVAGTRSDVKTSVTDTVENGISQRNIFYRRINEASQGNKITFNQHDIAMAQSCLRKIKREIDQTTYDIKGDYSKTYKRLLSNDIERMERAIGRMEPDSDTAWTPGGMNIMRDLIDYFNILLISGKK